MVTNSACQCLLEAFQGSSIASGINQIASIAGAVWAQYEVGDDTRLRPSVYTASRSRILSAPSVSGA